MEKNKYIFFEWVEDKPSTMVWAVRSKSAGDILGIIKWFPSWRQYCFFPKKECVWSKGCLDDLIKYIEKVNKEKKIIKLSIKEKKLIFVGNGIAYEQIRAKKRGVELGKNEV